MLQNIQRNSSKERIDSNGSECSDNESQMRLQFGRAYCGKHRIHCLKSLYTAWSSIDNPNNAPAIAKAINSISMSGHKKTAVKVSASRTPLAAPALTLLGGQWCTVWTGTVLPGSYTQCPVTSSTPHPNNKTSY